MTDYSRRASTGSVVVVHEFRIKPRAGATAANGVGARLSFIFDDDTGVEKEFGSIDVVSTDVSAGTEDAYFTVNVPIAGVRTEIMRWLSTGIATPDDGLIGFGAGSPARLSWDTTDANANELLLQLPAGGVVDVPVLAIGQGIESVDLGLFNGVVDPTIAIFGIGAVATGPRVRIYKARGTIAAPTVVTTGDDLFSIDAYGAVAAGEYVQAARILFEMTGTIATTRGPGVITFQTATDAAPSVLTTAMVISAAQLVTFSAGIQGNTRADIGISGTTTGIVGIDGATSGTVSLTVAAVAGTWTFTLPPTAGETGDVLVTDGAGVATWVSGVRSVDVQLTNAQILNLRATPITLVAAPGVNRALVLHKLYLLINATAGVYTETADNLVVEYSGGTDASGAIETTGWIDAASVNPILYHPITTVVVPVANEALRLFNTGDGEFGGGNAANTLSVRVWYSVVDTVAFT
mgnify:CR=1 FL=1